MRHSILKVLRAILSFETLVPQLMFRFSDGYQSQFFVGAFRRLVRNSGLLRCNDWQARTLYSFRYTYATFELLGKGTDINTFNKQMGNSAGMIERHYSKLTATMVADRLA
jgi:hypothetical protein